MPTFDVAVLIGRFQPFHNGHAELLVQALSIAHQVIMVLGSSWQVRDVKNPFLWEERATMISATLDELVRKRISFIPMRDYHDPPRWSLAIEQAVTSHCQADDHIVLVGFHKDASSYYLNLFPHWSLMVTNQYGEINATNIRQIYFAGHDRTTTITLLASLLPVPVLNYLDNWMNLPQFEQMCNEYHII